MTRAATPRVIGSSGKPPSGIEASLRGQDCGARWGGDEFAVLTPNMTTAAAHALAQRLLEQMARRLRTDGAAAASIGVATFDPVQDTAKTAEALMRDADAALYRAKAGGRHQVRVAKDRQGRSTVKILLAIVTRSS